MLDKLKRILFIIIQCTWGIVPTIIGLILFVKYKRYPHEVYRGCIDTKWDTRSGLSMGLFIFTPNESIGDSEKIRVHEYGHSIQSAVLGPFFIIIGFVSLFWGSHPYFVKLREVKKMRYTSCFVEAWASRWGELITGDTAIWD